MKRVVFMLVVLLSMLLIFSCDKIPSSKSETISKLKQELAECQAENQKLKGKKAETESKTVKVGLLMAFTGPIESVVPGMAQAAELAIKEASDSGAFLGGTKITAVRADSTCINATEAISAAKWLVNSENVIGIVGASCSGATAAVVNSVSVPYETTTISPSATSPALTNIKDNGFFFRSVPSDARQGEVLANIVINRGIKKVAVTYVNSDYGKGLSDSFTTNYALLGGQISVTVPHEDGKSDYTEVVALLSNSKVKDLVVFGYLDQGGKGIIKAALKTGVFDHFILADGMIGDPLTDDFGKAINGSFGTIPGEETISSDKWIKLAKTAGIPLNGPFRDGAYDAAALIILAAQAGKSVDKASIKKHMMSVANAPGEKIYAGELKKALKILANGGELDYVGAKNIEFMKSGEIFGSYRELEVVNAKFETIATH